MIDERQLANKPIKHIINEIELILSEKRTALSLLRTGITVLLFPMSVLTILLATSRYYDVMDALKFAIPLGVLCIGLFVFGLHLVIRAGSQIRKYDRAAGRLLKHSEYLRELLDLDD